MVRVFNMFVAVLAVVVALSWPEVSAQIHHVVGGDGGWSPGLDMSSWLSGREFRVGDKIWFSYPAGIEESIVELQSHDEFESCDLTNPIKMYTDGASHVTLDKEGVRYFTSGNIENCKNGLKLPVNVQQPPWFGPPHAPDHRPPAPTFEPPHPFYPPHVPSPPPPSPPPHVPSPPPHVPSSPPPSPPPHVPSPPPPLPPPHVPSPPPPSPPPHVPSPPPPSPPPHVPSPPPPSPPHVPPSASSQLNGLSMVLFAMLALGYMGLA